MPAKSKSLQTAALFLFCRECALEKVTKMKVEEITFTDLH